MGAHQHAACAPLPKETCCICQVTGGRTFSRIVRISTTYTCALVHAFILNQLDYCSSLYLGLPYVRLRSLDSVLRAAAILIGGVPKFGHIGKFMRDTLHWLPVRHRIFYRVSAIAWHCILDIAKVAGHRPEADTDSQFGICISINILAKR